MRNNDVNKLLHSRHIILLICTSLIINIAAGCTPAHINTSPSSDFASLCDDIFVHMVTSDGITLNYTLSNPEAYGITDYTPTLGSYSASAADTEYVYYENKLHILEGLDPAALDYEEQLTYDILHETLTSYMNTAEYRLYEEPLSPVTGIHAELPVLLSEYHYYNEASISDYYALLENVPAYFEQIIDFEKERLNAGLFMSHSQSEEIITQCRYFIENPDSNLLIEVFADNIAKLNLTDEQRRSYITRNNELVRESVIPAYQYLIDNLADMSGADTPCRGVCSFPDGKAYYTALVHSSTGSDMTPEEMYNILQETLDRCTAEMASIITANPIIYDKLDEVTYPCTTPEDIINYLASAISSEFPELPGSAGELNIKYVHPSLEDTLSPAMYISPPIDCDVTDDIYINRACCDDSALFTTLAHEGYPGHLYQSEYFMSTGAHPLRQILAFGGFVEGWATYTELYSYSIAGLNPNIATLLRDNKLAMLCIYGLIDIGIHYYDWSITDCARLLKDNGIDDSDSLQDIYLTVVSEPALYLKYVIGCIEFLRIRAAEEKRLGAGFNPVSYHKSILTTGPSWFGILERNVTIHDQ